MRLGWVYFTRRFLTPRWDHFVRRLPEVMRNLQNAPQQLQDKVQRELKMLVIQALQKAMNGKRLHHAGTLAIGLAVRKAGVGRLGIGESRLRTCESCVPDNPASGGRRIQFQWPAENQAADRGTAILNPRFPRNGTPMPRDRQNAEETPPGSEIERMEGAGSSGRASTRVIGVLIPDCRSAVTTFRRVCSGIGFFEGIATFRFFVRPRPV
jgi:hypothetical protein